MTPRQLRDKLGTSQASCCVPRATGDLKAGQSSETPCNQVAGPSPLHGEAHNARLAASGRGGPGCGWALAIQPKPVLRVRAEGQ